MTDPLLRLEAVGKRFPGGLVALDDFNLDIAEGEFLSLLGPSGCGKTTTLRVIAGFEAPSSGRLLLDGRDITALRPFERPVNTVFQDYALFPHMDVSENVGFGLSLRRIHTAERKGKVLDALARVGLSDKAGQRINALSGGQKQRVALARALVCEPRLLLLDEPLSALDANLRGQMQMELKRLQRDLGTTFIMVTHDQTEALSISDRIVVMNGGRIEQVASPAVLYDRPATQFVARFIGSMNLLSGHVAGRTEAGATVSAAGMVIVLPPDTEVPGIGAPVLVGIRPEDLLLSTEKRAGSTVARVIGTVFHGSGFRVQLRLDGDQELLVDVPRNTGVVSPSSDNLVHVMPRPGAPCPLLPIT